MTEGVVQIQWLEITIAMLPMLLVLALLFRWSDKGLMASYSVARMLMQLVVIGYFLQFIFEATQAWVITLVLLVMLAVASWIALMPLAGSRRQLYPLVLIALTIGGGITLFTMTIGVLHLDPWYNPRFMIPLAGMLFANSMNAVSISAERFESELANGQSPDSAQRIAFQTGMIPVINTMFAVGLVALPGMMTGQILSGVSPLIAARYQIVVMATLFTGSGLSAAIFLQLRCQLDYRQN